MTRERFVTPLGTLLTMIGVAVGLGNVWRFPYMVGRFGGAAFVLVYVAMTVAIGIPALMAEWALGRHTRRGPVGAFQRAGVPGGRAIGWVFFLVVTAATAYYTNVVGWVLFYAVGQAAGGIAIQLDASAILPPASGFVGRSFLLQLASTVVVILACVAVLLKGLRRGIELVSRFIVPALFVILLLLVARSVTLNGALEGIRWYILKFEPGDLTPRVLAAAMGQAVFSLALGGTFMVVYGSYLSRQDELLRQAAWTAAGDATVGLLAGLAILPAVFALGLEPSGGPGLLFSTLPGVFAQIPLGWLFGLIFFAGLFGAAYLSDVAAFEVLVAGLTDNTRLTRASAVWLVAAAVLLFAIPPMINNRVFVPWDLAFGSGAQTVGALAAMIAIGWAMSRADALKELSSGGGSRAWTWLYYWIKYVIPTAIIAVAVWWFYAEVLGA